MLRKILLFVLLVFFFSCEKQGIIIKCKDCTIDEPSDATLEVVLHRDFYGGPIQLNIYEGNLEDSIVFRSYSSVGERTTITVPLNKKYTATATYYKLGDKYVAVDSATPKVRYDKDQCDEPCYYVYDTFINLKIKHY